MIVRSFLMVFSLFIALAVIGMSHRTYSAVSAGDIDAVAREFIAQHSQQVAQQYGDSTRVEYRIDRLDNRLNMSDCSTPIRAELKSKRSVGRINILIRCDSDSRWTLYVPAEIKLFRPVVTPSAPVDRGTVIAAEDLALREMDTSQLNGNYFTEISEVVGMEARRLLKSDQPVISAHLKAPLMIRKGDAVILTANGGGLRVKMPGVALQDGHHRQQISVRNTQSKRVVEAQITAPGQVEVPM